MGVAENIRELRRRAGITQAELAAVLGVTKETVCRWERGKTSVKPRILDELSRRFDVSHDALVGEDTGLAATPEIQTEGSVDDLEADHRDTLLGKQLALFRTSRSSNGPNLLRCGAASAPEDVAARHEGSFFVHMDGHEMSKCYPSGSVLLIDPRMRPWNGCAVLALTDNNAPVIRRYSSGNNMIILSSHSYKTSEPDLILDRRRVRVLGVVVWFQASHDLNP